MSVGRNSPPKQGRSSTGGGGVAVLLSAKKFGRVFNLAGGRQLATFEPNSLNNHALAVSPGGRFFAVASFTADIKVGSSRRREDVDARGVASNAPDTNSSSSHTRLSSHESYTHLSNP
jgi:hypothetical protein